VELTQMGTQPIRQRYVDQVKLDASGSGYSRGGEQVSRSCSVRIELLYNGVV